MSDYFRSEVVELHDPAEHAEAVTPGTDLTRASRALYVGGAGDVEVVTTRGDTVVFAAVPAGSLLPVRVTQVASGSTTATNIVAIS